MLGTYLQPQGDGTVAVFDDMGDLMGMGQAVWIPAHQVHGVLHTQVQDKIITIPAFSVPGHYEVTTGLVWDGGQVYWYDANWQPMRVPLDPYQTVPLPGGTDVYNADGSLWGKVSSGGQIGASGWLALVAVTIASAGAAYGAFGAGVVGGEIAGGAVAGGAAIGGAEVVGATTLTTAAIDTAALNIAAAPTIAATTAAETAGSIAAAMTAPTTVLEEGTAFSATAEQVVTVTSFTPEVIAPTTAVSLEEGTAFSATPEQVATVTTYTPQVVSPTIVDVIKDVPTSPFTQTQQSAGQIAQSMNPTPSVSFEEGTAFSATPEQVATVTSFTPTVVAPASVASLEEGTAFSATPEQVATATTPATVVSTGAGSSIIDTVKTAASTINTVKSTAGAVAATMGIGGAHIGSGGPVGTGVVSPNLDNSQSAAQSAAQMVPLLMLAGAAVLVLKSRKGR